MSLRIKALAGILEITWVWTTLNHAQEPANRFGQARLLHLNGVDMAAILANMAFEYRTTIGLEVDPDKPKSQITLDLRDATFLQIIDGIVKAEPKYRWRERDGAIEVFPANGGSSLLDIPIQSYQVKDVNRALAVNRLLDLPEVQAMFSPMNLRPRPPSPPSYRIKDEKLSFDLSGMTLRQALNRIATDSGGRFWVFRRHPDGTFEISLR
jgi:hypothetical protein